MTTSTPNQAIVLTSIKNLTVRNDDLPAPGEGEAQVQIISTGLCGSDLHYYEHLANGEFKVRDPLVLGHESAGIVVALGPPEKPSDDPKVKRISPNPHPLRVGMRVAIEAGVMCRECRYCLDGRYNLCPGMRFASSAKTWPHLDGTLREKMNHPVWLLHPLPDPVTYTDGALAEPLSVLLHAARRAHLPLPTLAKSAHSSKPLYPSYPLPSRPPRILVIGTGPIGMLACLVARTSVKHVKDERAKAERREEQKMKNEAKLTQFEKESAKKKNYVTIPSANASISLNSRLRSDSGSTSTSSVSSVSESSPVSPLSSSLSSSDGSVPSSPLATSSRSRSGSEGEVGSASDVDTAVDDIDVFSIDDIVSMEKSSFSSAGYFDDVDVDEDEDMKYQDKEVDEGLICAMDLIPARLRFAKENGFADRVFDSTVDPTDTTGIEDDKDGLKLAQRSANRAFAGLGLHLVDSGQPVSASTASLQDSEYDHIDEFDGFDVVYECSGAKSCVQMAQYLARPGGTVLLVGMGTRNVDLHVGNLQAREVDVKGCFRYAACYPLAIGLLERARIEREREQKSVFGVGEQDAKKEVKKATLADVSKLTTHRFPLLQTAEAFETLARKDDDGGVVLKVVVDGSAPPKSRN